MRYVKLRQLVQLRDPNFANSVRLNPFTNVMMQGKLSKKTVGFYERWQDRYVVLTNAGMIQFKLDHAEKGNFEEPTKFRDLTDYVVVPAVGQDDTRKFTFWVIFKKIKGVERVSSLLATDSEHEMNLWMDAFRRHQYYTCEGRINLYKKRLDILAQKDAKEEKKWSHH